MFITKKEFEKRVKELVKENIGGNPRVSLNKKIEKQNEEIEYLKKELKDYNKIISETFGFINVDLKKIQKDIFELKEKTKTTAEIQQDLHIKKVFTAKERLEKLASGDFSDIEGTGEENERPI